MLTPTNHILLMIDFLGRWPLLLGRLILVLFGIMLHYAKAMLPIPKRQAAA